MGAGKRSGRSTGALLALAAAVAGTVAILAPVARSATDCGEVVEA
jgi:hypothetical protein